MKKIVLGLSVMMLVTGLYAVELKSCYSCHGQTFEKVALGKSKVVKDMNVTEIESSLIGYKNNTYGGPMKGLMRGQVLKYNNDELKEFAKLIKGTNNE